MNKMEVVLRVKVIPNASRNELVGWIRDACKIKIRAVPEKGKANEALCEFLSEVLELRKNQVEIVGGESSREKKIVIRGLTQAVLFEKLNLAIK